VDGEITHVAWRFVMFTVSQAIATQDGCHHMAGSQTSTG